MSRCACVVAAALLLTACAGGQNRPMLCQGVPSAEYPPAARAAGIEGFVTLAYDVGADGSIDNINVVESDPPGIFDAAAIRAIARLDCSAPVLKGTPRAAVAVPSTIRFKLGEAEAYADY